MSLCRVKPKEIINIILKNKDLVKKPSLVNNKRYYTSVVSEILNFLEHVVEQYSNQLRLAFQSSDSPFTKTRNNRTVKWQITSWTQFYDK